MQELSYKKLLLSGKARIGVWGVGYIGYSTLVAYAAEGVKTIGFDVNPKRVENVNNGLIDIPALADWIGIPLAPFVQKGTICATSDFNEILASDIIIHFICVPTEDFEKPTNKFLLEVFGKLLRRSRFPIKPIVIIESTLTPGTTDKVLIPFLAKYGLQVGKDLFLAVAPRRDWFVEKTKRLKVLDRVFGATDSLGTKIAQDVLSIVCDKLHAAPSHREAEIAKGVENAYRQMDIALANQLTLAYPNIDIKEVLRLAGTKWNMNTYRPSFGTGGYCIPLASKYVLQGAKRPEYLTLLKEAMRTERMMPKAIVNSLVQRKIKKVGILGLSYKGNLKVPTLSPTIPLVQFLKRRLIKVSVYDPLYSNKEIKDITGAQSFDFPEELDDFDALLLEADHSSFGKNQVAKKLKKLKRVRLILDNTGMWENFQLGNPLEYHVVGEPGWLGEENGN